MRHINVLANALKSINNAKKRGKLQICIRLCSKVHQTVMMKHDYIGESEIINDHRAGKIIVNHIGRLNKYGVISPDLMCNSKISQNGRATCQFRLTIMPNSSALWAKKKR